MAQPNRFQETSTGQCDVGQKSRFFSIPQFLDRLHSGSHPEPCALLLEFWEGLGKPWEPWLREAIGCCKPVVTLGVALPMNETSHYS